MSRHFLFLLVSIILILSGFVASAPSSSSPAISATTSMVKFENGYSVETVLDGSKLGIEPYSLQVLPNGELLILDSQNSNIYKIASSLTLYSRPRLVTGSPDGYPGHVDGKLRDARLNNPKGFTVDDRGNIYVADTVNNAFRKISEGGKIRGTMADSRPRLVTGSPDGYPGHVDGRLRDARLNNPKGFTVDDRGNIYVADTVNNAFRKISEGGVTTIAGGKMVHGGGHVDGPSEDAMFSNDFDVVYLGSSCSLLVIDRGNQAIREIQLHFDDCADQYGSDFPLGIAVLVAAGFFGYMLALLQRRLSSIISYRHTDQEVFEAAPDQEPIKAVRSPLIQTRVEQEKEEESFLGTLQIFISNVWLFSVELFSGIYPGLRKKQTVIFNFNHQEAKHSAFSTTSWPIQESFVIHNEDEPPPVESRNLTPRKVYSFMSKDATEKMQQLRQSRALYRSLDSEFLQEQQQQKHHRRHHSTIPHTVYERSCEKTNEIVFGQGQEQDHRRVAAAATATSSEFGEQTNSTTHQNIHYRAHQSVSYPYGYYSYT